MEKLLHIIATPRGRQSRALRVSAAFLRVFSQKYPRCRIDELNVATLKLPSLTVKVVAGKYELLTGKELSGNLKAAWKEVMRHIERFLSADAYLLSVPMWNFSIPYTLKQYLDIIVQPKYLFRYTDKGVEGLAKNKKMAVIIARGADYSPDTSMQQYDFQEPYLRAIFGFVGITDIQFIIAQPMDMGERLRDARLEEAILKAQKIADNF
jgi:FMN-dependent NADH-azoreductase